MDLATRVTNCLLGQDLLTVVRYEHQCLFHFANNMVLSVECAWRIMADGIIAYGYEDHAQQFGLPAPIDGLEKTNGLILNKTVQAVEIRDDTSDLTISFADQRALECLNMSMGYEGWHLTDGVDLYIIALGGGQLSIPTKIIRG